MAEHMAEQTGTPGSNADTSINGSRSTAPKDKLCPFCQQPHTSSSLGRHLDLWIKKKNPKAPDGVHDVIQIREMRKAITRRQQRSSTRAISEDSTPKDTPGATERGKSPKLDGRSPSLRKEDVSLEQTGFSGRPAFTLNTGTWESTGVMNNIPQARNGAASRNWDGEGLRDGRMAEEGRNRSSSKQQSMAKNIFEQKQKIAEAQDTARAATLALRELMGSIRAAKQRVEGPEVFDYDPLTLDFPSLILHCLPPPPSLHQALPIPSPLCWSIHPPDNTQYQALRKHFTSEFHRWRSSIDMANTVPKDDLTYPPAPNFTNGDDIDMVLESVRVQSNELEARIAAHVDAAYRIWGSISQSQRAELWNLSLAKNISRKSDEITRLKKDKERLQQEANHYQLQVNELQRLQQPREFRVEPPGLYPLNPRVIADLRELSLGFNHVGFDVVDRGLPMDEAVQRAIGRWKRVVKDNRGGQSPGLAAQKTLDGESASNIAQRSPLSQQYEPSPKGHTVGLRGGAGGHEILGAAAEGMIGRERMGGREVIGNEEDADGDADMDAAMDLYGPAGVQGRGEANANAQFRLQEQTGGNANNGGGSGSMSALEGMENQKCVGGYLRIGS